MEKSVLEQLQEFTKYPIWALPAILVLGAAIILILVYARTTPKESPQSNPKTSVEINDKNASITGTIPKSEQSPAPTVVEPGIEVPVVEVSVVDPADNPPPITFVEGTPFPTGHDSIKPGNLYLVAAGIYHTEPEYLRANWGRSIATTNFDGFAEIGFYLHHQGSGQAIKGISFSFKDPEKDYPTARAHFLRTFPVGSEQLVNYEIVLWDLSDYVICLKPAQFSILAKDCPLPLSPDEILHAIESRERTETFKGRRVCWTIDERDTTIDLDHGQIIVALPGDKILEVHLDQSKLDPEFKDYAPFAEIEIEGDINVSNNAIQLLNAVVVGVHHF